MIGDEESITPEPSSEPLDELREDIETAKLDDGYQPTGPALPFISADPDDETTWVIASKADHPATAALPDPPAFDATIGEQLAVQRAGGPSAHAASPPIFAPTPPGLPISPPAMFRPLARPDAPPDGRATGAEGAPAPGSDAALIEAYPLDRCARIAAKLDCRAAMRAAILRAEEIDDADYRKLEARVRDELRDEADRRSNELLKRHDEAYVAQIEAERGPLTPADYARLVVAGERGNVEPALAALGLPSAARMRVQRVWIAKASQSAALAAELRAAVKAAREGR